MSVDVSFGRQVCGSLEEGTRREWLVTDGLGGYATGTVSGLRTRRYHGLLITAGTHAGDRHLSLAALDAVVTIGDRRISLAVHEWRDGTVAPDGWVHLERFAVEDGVPSWRWSIGSLVIEREVAMERERGAVVIRHRVLRADSAVKLEMTPLCTWRDAHGERHAGADPEIALVDRGFVFESRYRVAGPGYIAGGAWYHGAYLRSEEERGLPDHEDLWAAGSFTAQLDVGESVSIVAATRPYEQLPDADAVIDGARSRRRTIVARAQPTDRFDERLVAAADAFVIATPAGPGVVAGYPWFGEWGRDTMVSYEGLFIETRREEEGRALLKRHAQAIDGGMLANTADAGSATSPAFNSVDGTLWFVHAVERHVARTGDVDLAAELLEQLDAVVETHIRGARFGIGTDPHDGLLGQGAPGEALTWMDARIDGVPVTPRRGKAVEVQALWINALGALDALRAAVGLDGHWQPLREQAIGSFRSAFTGGHVPDIIGVNDPDDRAALRPNCVFAGSLPYGPGLDARALSRVSAGLLTSLGLRSLDPGHRAYRARHAGDARARDFAYHQGTVWPWLIGPYVDACENAGTSPVGVLEALEAHLDEWGLCSISETAEAGAPHVATGCPFQAWSVAEVLRAHRRIGRTASNALSRRH